MSGRISHSCVHLSNLIIWTGISISIQAVLAFSFHSTSHLPSRTIIALNDAHWPHLIGRRQPNTLLKEKPEWLADAMGSDNDDGDEDKESNPTDTATIIPKLATGLSGFCLDPDLGFVAILTSLVASSADDDHKEVPKYVAVTVVPATAQAADDASFMPARLNSPQALTLVQLAGGLDLGTPILPPDALWITLLREGIDSDDDEEDEEDLEDESAPTPLVTLLGIDVVPNEDYDSSSSRKEKLSSLVPTKAEGWSEDWMQDESRLETIQERATQVLVAVKGLPGLSGVTVEQVADAMMYCANQEGALDRQGFSHLLDYMRRVVGVSSSAVGATTDGGMNWTTDSKVKFVLTVNLVQQNSIKTVSVTTLDAFRAIGLSMRHKIQLQVAPDCLEEEANTILEKFPAFRSIQELWEDAKVMDGFIPSMFEQAKKQKGNGPSQN